MIFGKKVILDNSGGFTDIDKIEFTNYAVLEKCNIYKAYIIQEEIYKVKRGFEFHLLLYNYGDLDYFTIFSESIIFHFDNCPNYPLSHYDITRNLTAFRVVGLLYEQFVKNLYNLC